MRKNSSASVASGKKTSLELVLNKDKMKDLEDYEKNHRLQRSSRGNYKKMLTKISERERENKQDELDDDEDIALREDADDVDSFDSDEDENEKDDED